MLYFLKRSCLFTVMIIGFAGLGYAALPVTHIVFAEMWMKDVAHYDVQKTRQFLIGNLFPDVRYLGDVTREDTHESNIRLEDIIESSTPFQAGCRLHVWVDEFREALVLDWQMYPYLKDYADGHEAALLKLIEDELLFKRINRPRVRKALMVILDEEMAVGVAKKTVQKWHALLIQYFAMPPSQILKLLALGGRPLFDVPAATIRRWSALLPMLVQQEHFIDYVNRLENVFAEAIAGVSEHHLIGLDSDCRKDCLIVDAESAFLIYPSSQTNARLSF